MLVTINDLVVSCLYLLRHTLDEANRRTLRQAFAQPVKAGRGGSCSTTPIRRAARRAASGRRPDAAWLGDAPGRGLPRH